MPLANPTTLFALARKWTLRRLQIRASPRAAFIYLEALEIVST